MAGSRPLCEPGFFSVCALLLLGFCINETEASPRVIHKKVGDSVEITSGLPNKGVTKAKWTYNDTTIAMQTLNVNSSLFFGGRLKFNDQTFHLTITNLNLEDSGKFTFTSLAKGNQRPSVIIFLLVHEAIKEKPTLKYHTQKYSNQSCTVTVECHVEFARDLNYTISVRNRTHHGSSLQDYLNRPEEELNFTCTAFNPVSNTSTSKMVTCQDDSQNEGKSVILLIAATSGGVLVIIVIAVIIAVCLCKAKDKGGESNELTIYADISDVACNERRSSTMQVPCSLYDTIDDKMVTASPAIPTVYDKLNFNR